MRLPREISGKALIAKLKKYGYQVQRQKGSHIRLITSLEGEHYYSAKSQSDQNRNAIWNNQ